MKIIKNGDMEKVNNPKIFECKKCGCVFEANYGEYRYSFGTEPSVFARCPMCKNISFEKKK